jgi:hypothetical protein
VLVALTTARRAPWLGLLVVALGLTPPSFMLVGVIWRDVLFAGLWLLAAAIVYSAAERPKTPRRAAQGLALALIGLGLLLRPNAILAAPLLAAHALGPERWNWKKALLIFAPAVLVGYGFVHVVYYELLGAKHQNPLHSILVFDLGGITHFTQENQFPVTWNSEQSALLTSRCYEPQHWDSYWTTEPCRFVMLRLEDRNDLIFGTPRLVAAWWQALRTHPAAYLRHRVTVMKIFLFDENLTLPTYGAPNLAAFADNHAFAAMLALHERLRSTFMFRAGVWLLLAAAIGAIAAFARAGPGAAFSAAINLSALIYVASFAVLGIAADFRYAYWAVLSSLAGAIPAALAPHRSAGPGP